MGSLSLLREREPFLLSYLLQPGVPKIPRRLVARHAIFFILFYFFSNATPCPLRLRGLLQFFRTDSAQLPTQSTTKTKRPKLKATNSCTYTAEVNSWMFNYCLSMAWIFSTEALWQWSKIFIQLYSKLSIRDSMLNCEMVKEVKSMSTVWRDIAWEEKYSSSHYLRSG